MRKDVIYAIVNPEGYPVSYHFDEWRVWYLFFSYGEHGDGYSHRAPIADAIKAYESIGYRRKRINRR